MSNIGLNDFRNAGISGFGQGPSGDVAELSKALETGYATTGQTGGAALRVESLEASLKVLTYTSANIRFWKRIPKSPAYSTAEQYNQLTQYGGDQSPFIGEGETPQSTDASFIRRTEYVKYLGTTREVTHQASLVHPAHGDLIALQNQTGILWMLQQLERHLFEGDASLAADGESEMFNGLNAMIDSSSLIDMEGNSLQEADIEEAANTIVENYGYATDMFLGLRAMSDLTKTMYPRSRVALPAPVNGQVGNSIGSIMTSGGPVEFSPDVFIRKTPVAPNAATSSSAPATPASIAVGAATGTTGDHAKGAPTGTTYFAYLVTACNRFGESAPTAVAVAATATTAANKTTGIYWPLTITNAASIGAFVPEYYKVYRSEASSTNAVPASLSSYYEIAKVPADSQAAAGTTVYNDVNLILPNSSSAYIGELSPSVLTFRQLLPMMKMDLAITGPAYRWMILLYGTPIMFAPKKWLRFINIKQLDLRA